MTLSFYRFIYLDKYWHLFLIFSWIIFQESIPNTDYLPVIKKQMYAVFV